MSKPIALLLALCSLVGLAACGGDDDDDDAGAALTKAEWIEQGDAICGRLSADQDELATPTGEDEIVPYLEATLAIGREGRADLAALTPPADGEAVQEAQLAAFDATIELAEKALAAAEEGDFETMQATLEEAGVANDEADEQLVDYGFTDCGTEDDDS